MIVLHVAYMPDKLIVISCLHWVVINLIIDDFLVIILFSFSIIIQISGLSLNNSIEEIAILYLATVQSLAVSTMIQGI